MKTYKSFIRLYNCEVNKKNIVLTFYEIRGALNAKHFNKKLKEMKTFQLKTFSIAVTLQFDDSAVAIFQKCSEIFCKIHKRTPVQELFGNRLHCKYFLGNSVKLFITPIL